ncbi:hypothetical protein NHX12_006675 [Muraenolepis orangiensis]|uniref:Uncharacterized protein n=1 Tax=Muraenolepis orangiensis TaxID=630683 RepID=A0A9Q0DRZ5_9TELE|nr:hypothetical protein NHX12_006675 [Muraenolepis orangiensis]
MLDVAVASQSAKDPDVLWHLLLKTPSLQLLMWLAAFRHAIIKARLYCLCHDTFEAMTSDVTQVLLLTQPSRSVDGWFDHQTAEGNGQKKC